MPQSICWFCWWLMKNFILLLQLLKFYKYSITTIRWLSCKVILCLNVRINRYIVRSPNIRKLKTQLNLMLDRTLDEFTCSYLVNGTRNMGQSVALVFYGSEETLYPVAALPGGFPNTVLTRFTPPTKSDFSNRRGHYSNTLQPINVLCASYPHPPHS